MKPIIVPPLHASIETDEPVELSETMAVRAAVALVRAYQVIIRPLLTGSCRFLPTCSEYAIQSLHAHGVIRGGWMSLRRVMRCHPFGGSGLDPVPAPRNPVR